MKQTCLCQYLGIVCNHADTFLRLPASIRERIYQYAGLVSDTCIKVSEDNEWDDFTFNIFDVCKTTRIEAEGMILSQNTLVIRHKFIDEGLGYLGSLSPYACSKLRTLYVHLYCLDHVYYVSETKLPQLTWERIHMWQHVAMYILSHATTHQLRLHLICDVGDSTKKKTEAIVQPFRQFPGVLLELSLRLCRWKDPKLISLAHDTVLRAQCPDPHARQGHFRFFELPVEVRREIFSYTNLVTPFRRVEWSSGQGFSCAPPYCECDGTVCREKDLHHAFSFYRCDAYGSETGDFCSKRHSSYASRCQHGFSPRALMLVSRAMYEEAIDFFYANNRVVIIPKYSLEASLLPYGIEPSYIERHEGRDETMSFLNRLRPEVVRRIQTLEVLFPPFSPEFSPLDADPLDTNTAYHQWCLAVERLAAHADVPRLTLVVHMWTGIRRPVTFPLDRASYHFDSHCERLLEPLRRLSHMRRLFVHLHWATHWAPPKLLREIEKLPRVGSPGCGIGEHYIPEPDGDIVQKEVRFERMVMGDGYDSGDLGKADELPSPWLRNSWDRLM